jgi:hypothetical protein
MACAGRQSELSCRAKFTLARDQNFRDAKDRLQRRHCDAIVVSVAYFRGRGQVATQAALRISIPWQPVSS